jgi:pimeloyl-ACP methyl ester carboxylesterase
MRRLGLQRPVIVGHSWGANVALELVVRRPRSVRGAVLVDGGFVALRDRMDWPTTREALAPPDLAGMRVERLLGFVHRGLGPFVEVTPAVEAIVLSQFSVDRAGRIRPRLSRANHLRILRALWEQDTPQLLRRARRPTLVLAARSPKSAGDRPEFLEARRRGGREIEAIGSPLRFEWVDGIHDLPLQRPEALARRIVRAARS